MHFYVILTLRNSTITFVHSEAGKQMFQLWSVSLPFGTPNRVTWVKPAGTLFLPTAVEYFELMKFQQQQNVD